MRRRRFSTLEIKIAEAQYIEKERARQQTSGPISLFSFASSFCLLHCVAFVVALAVSHSHSLSLSISVVSHVLAYEKPTKQPSLVCHD